MFIFWWTGKGWMTPVIVLFVLCVTGIVAQLFLSRDVATGWAWGVGFLVAAVLNWTQGRKSNAKRIAAVRSNKLRHQLLYPARHRFMSLPFELWSVPLLSVGLIGLASAAISQMKRAGGTCSSR